MKTKQIYTNPILFYLIDSIHLYSIHSMLYQMISLLYYIPWIICNKSPNAIKPIINNPQVFPAMAGISPPKLEVLGFTMALLWFTTLDYPHPAPAICSPPHFRHRSWVWSSAVRKKPAPTLLRTSKARSDKRQETSRRGLTLAGWSISAW